MAINWDKGAREVNAALDKYADSVEEAVRVVADIFAVVIEGYAKQNAKWEDRTGQARANLRAYAEEMAESVVGLMLESGAPQAKFLETMQAGKFAIVWPTLQKHLPEIEAALVAIFEDR